MKNKKDNFFAVHTDFLWCLLIIFFLAVVYKVCKYYAESPMRELRELPMEAICSLAYKTTLPLAYTGNEPCRRGNRRLYLYGQKIPGASVSALMYDLEKKDVFLEIDWFHPVNRGQYFCYYEIPSSEDKVVLLKFIAEHEEDLCDQRLQSCLLKILKKHCEDLAKLGDGDPYIGLERAGVAEWIKAGKDPEVEWRKKYPAEEL